ncbi:MAG: hypothetical protein WC998_06735 [Candidatus Paceibacterota bacterium]
MEPKTYQNKPNGFKIVLEDGTEGNLVEKNSDKGLRVGDTVEATVTDYVSKSKGTHSNLITLKLVSETQQNPVQTETKAAPAKVQGTPTNLQALKAQSVVKAMEFMINTFIADKITWDQIQPKFKELSGYLIDGIEECNKG